MSGAKRHTIRARRKNPIKVGDKLYMWWKSRSPKEKEKLGEAKCINVASITIKKDGYSINSDNLFLNSGEFSDDLSLCLLAISDGFNNWQELIDFFELTHGLPFEGDLIAWDSIKYD